jgi:uncharacterized protein (TIGR00299 family) protein
MGLEDVEVASNEVRPHGIGAVRFTVSYQERGQPHRSWREVRALLDRAGLDPGARERAEAIFQRLAAAEARIHGTSEDEVVFHEVGAVDSIADIVGCAIALEQLKPDTITSSAPVLGGGTTRSHHGPIPVPSPATLELLKGIPTRGAGLDVELTTPTGAAILASQVGRFCSWPELRIAAIGYGAGTRELQDRPNLLRAILGESVAESKGEELLVEANIDDMNPEHYEHLMEQLLAGGAHDVWLQPVIMKKSRPAVTISVLCAEGRLEALEGILFRESTTIGVRRLPVWRRKLARRRDRVRTSFGDVHMKVSGEGGEDWTASPEYDDCRALALQHGVPLKAIFQAAMAAWHGKTGG